MSKTKQSYMVAINLVITPTIYIEEIAASEKEAVDAVKKARAKLLKLHKAAFLAEAEIEIADATPITQLQVHGAGLSSQYHTPEECEICSKLAKQQKRPKLRRSK